MHRLTCFALLVVSTACPAADGDPDGNGTGSESSSGSATNASSSASSTSAGSATASTSASTSASSTDTSSTTATTDEPTTDSTASSVDTTTASESSGGDDPCVGLTREECVANEACHPLACRPFVMAGAGVVQWCLGPQEFLGCQSADIACGEARTVGCLGDDAPTYICPDTCLPAGAFECEPPVEGDVPSCP